jgi:hypothetical protein
MLPQSVITYITINTERYGIFTVTIQNSKFLFLSLNLFISSIIAFYAQTNNQFVFNKVQKL